MVARGQLWAVLVALHSGHQSGIWICWEISWALSQWCCLGFPLGWPIGLGLSSTILTAVFKSWEPQQFSIFTKRNGESTTTSLHFLSLGDDYSRGFQTVGVSHIYSTTFSYLQIDIPCPVFWFTAVVKESQFHLKKRGFNPYIAKEEMCKADVTAIFQRLIYTHHALNNPTEGRSWFILLLSLNIFAT